VAPTKLANVTRSGQEVRLLGTDSGDTERGARAFAEQEGWHYVSPYNDRDVIAGQGTIGLELLRQLPTVDEVYVSVGGGGLIAGIATAIKAAKPSVKIIGCSAENSCVLHESVRAGRVLDLPSLPTFSDGTAGGIEDGTITLAICTALVDAWVTVSEREIAGAMRDYIDECHVLLEGAAGVAFAAMHKHASSGASHESKVRVAIGCGANIGAHRLREVLEAAQ
jgi:threonine dehydratase